VTGQEVEAVLFGTEELGLLGEGDAVAGRWSFSAVGAQPREVGDAVLDDEGQVIGT
jgi:hypothetical protein